MWDGVSDHHLWVTRNKSIRRQAASGLGCDSWQSVCLVCEGLGSAPVLQQNRTKPNLENRANPANVTASSEVHPAGGACRPPQLLRFTVSRTCSFPQLLLPLGQSCSSFKIWWPHAYQCRFSPYDANKCWEKCGETGTPVHCCGAGVALLPNCGETWLLKAVLWLHEHPHSHTRHTQNRYKLILKDANNPSFQQLRKRKHAAQPTAEHFSGMETYYILKTLRPVTDDHSVKWAHGQIHREIRQC